MCVLCVCVLGINSKTLHLLDRYSTLPLSYIPVKQIFKCVINEIRGYRGGARWAFPHSVWCGLWIVMYGLLLCWGTLHLLLICWEFYREGVLNLSMAFSVSVSVEVILYFLSFILLVWCIIFIHLYISNHLCFPGMNPSWSWWMIFFNVLLSSVC